VQPEEMDDWMLPPDEESFWRDWTLPDEWQGGSGPQEMADGRARLMRALNAGARESHPELAARAQGRFDCWVEQQEENHQLDHIAACRDQFFAALEQLEAAMMPQQTEQPAVPMMPDVYIVYFDWDRSDIRPDAAAVISDVVSDAASMGSPPIS